MTASQRELFPVLGDLDRLRLRETDRVCEVLSEEPATEVVDDAHLVVAEAIDAVLQKECARIVDRGYWRTSFFE